MADMKPDFAKATPRPWFQDEDDIWAGGELIGSFEYAVFGKQNIARNEDNAALTVYAVNAIEAVLEALAFREGFAVEVGLRTLRAFRDPGAQGRSIVR